MGDGAGTIAAGGMAGFHSRYWVRLGGLAAAGVALAALAWPLAQQGEPTRLAADAPWLAVVVGVAYAALTVQPLLHTDRGRSTTIDAGSVVTMVALVLLPAGLFLGAMVAGHAIGWSWHRRGEGMPLLTSVGGRKLAGNVAANLTSVASALLAHTLVCAAVPGLPNAVCAGAAVTVAEGVSLLGLALLVADRPLAVVRPHVRAVLASPSPWVVLVVGGLVTTVATRPAPAAAWLAATVVVLVLLGRHQVGLHDELEQHRALLGVARDLPTRPDRASIERLLLDRARTSTHAGSATFEDRPPRGDSFGVPLEEGGATRWLVVHDRSHAAETFRPAERETLRGVATLGGLALRNVALAEDLHHAATHDQLTGLLSRRGLQDRWAQVAARAARHGRSVGVVYVDLDGFKQVNDRRGHAAGDAVLRAAATRLHQAARDSDLVCRVGGDEFLLVAEGVADAVALAALVARVRTALGPRPGGAAAIPASVGAARLPEDGRTLDEVTRVADAAMYRDKRDG